MVTAHRVNIAFIESLSTEEKKAFAVLMLIKNRFVSSYIKNYNCTKLSKEIGVSRYSIDKLMHIIISKWASVENGNIQLHSYKKIYSEFDYNKKSRRIIKVSRGMSIGLLVDELNFALLRRHIDRQEYRARPKRIQVGLNFSEFKTSVKEVKKHRLLFKNKHEIFDGELIGHCVFGMRKLSEILKCSPNSAGMFIKRLVNRGLITIKHEIRQITGIEFVKRKSDMTDYVSNRIGYFYEIGNKLFQHVGTKIDINFSEPALLQIRLRNNVNIRSILHSGNKKIQTKFVQFPTLDLKY